LAPTPQGGYNTLKNFISVLIMLFSFGDLLKNNEYFPSVVSWDGLNNKLFVFLNLSRISPLFSRS